MKIVTIEITTAYDMNLLDMSFYMGNRTNVPVYDQNGDTEM